jgi:two-component system sensor histidine kinase AlgZ
LAFILVLTVSVGKHWNDLAMTSMFIQWVALSGMVLLCVCRRWLRLMENVAAGIVSYIIILAVTLLLSEAVYWLV